MVYHFSCEICGRPFTATHRNARTCSTACRVTLHRRKVRAEKQAAYSTLNFWERQTAQHIMRRTGEAGLDVLHEICKPAPRNEWGQMLDHILRIVQLACGERDR